jgi:cell division septation protein DedD
MTIEQLEKLLVRPDPVGSGSVAPARPSQTLVDERRKRRQTTPGKNWLRIRAVLNVCTGRRPRRLLRCASGLLLVGGVAYLGFLALVDDDRPVDRTRIIPADQQKVIMPSDEQQATISSGSAHTSGSVHNAPPEEQSSYSLTSTQPDMATEPLKNSSLGSPDRNTAVPANDGGYVVQVSAERSDARAQASFKTLQSRYPHVLGGRSPLIRRVRLGEKGIFYRAQVGPFDTVEQAKQLCAKLKSGGGHCMVQKNS